MTKPTRWANQISIHLDRRMGRLVDLVAGERECSRSSVIRSYVRRGLKADGYLDAVLMEDNDRDD